MATATFELDKFDSDDNFNVWMIKMNALLVHQGLYSVLVKQEGGANEDGKKIDKISIEILSKAHGALILSLGDQVLREVSEESTAAVDLGKATILVSKSDPSSQTQSSKTS